MLCAGVPTIVQTSDLAEEASALEELLRREVRNVIMPELDLLKAAVASVEELLKEAADGHRTPSCSSIDAEIHMTEMEANETNQPHQEPLAEAAARAAFNGQPGPPRLFSDEEGAGDAAQLPQTPAPDIDESHNVSRAMRARTETRPDAEALARLFPTFESQIIQVDSIRAKIGVVEAPKRSDIVSRIADSWLFQASANVATVLNCAFLTYSADWQARNFSEKESRAITLIDHAFLGVFILEMAVRLWRHRCYYFASPRFVMNWIDFIVVVGGLVDVIASQMSKDLDLTVVRTLRTFRLLRVLRVLRVAGMFRTLRAIVMSLSSTIPDIFWCTLMIIMIQYMFALVFVMRIGTFLRSYSDTLTEKQVKDLTDVFGNTLSSMLQLFTVSMGGGDWVIHFEILSPTGKLNQALYLLFVVFSFIALLNVILGIFVDRAMKSLVPTAEEKAHHHAEEEILVEKELRKICEDGDIDADGTLSRAEWDAAFSKGTLSSYMEAMGFRGRDLRKYFKILADHSEDGKVNIDEFVHGCMQLRGPSSRFNVQALLVDLKEVKTLMKKRVTGGQGHDFRASRCSSDWSPTSPAY